MAVLLYVSLDLSLPMMPGAFVFDVGDSVESVQTHRGRLTAEVLPTLAKDSSLVSQPRIEVANQRLATPATSRRLVVPWCRSCHRAALDPAPSSEEPH